MIKKNKKDKKLPQDGNHKYDKKIEKNNFVEH